ncbi:alpha/beta hydrolase [Terricaulis sp.]|uniref:alpha/beta hydrolase n=1 Tax=Terricaulis sp. TaxID=2768686 RepID=UPI002AC7D0FE|nr:alpha/beta hydrolase [Terricaulis sp.]MDZ4692967.1 alpha/beta hydrolase [Terricaulis sp.]
MDRRVIYCHGLPGSPEELSAFGAWTPRQHVHGLDRLGHHNGPYEENVLLAFDAIGVDEPVTLVGFSLGAMSAVRIAAERGPLVRKLILISPAAPLQLGNFLPVMAGRPVFEAAQAGDLALRLFTASQASLVALAPKLAVKTMFRASTDAELDLLASPRFVEVVVRGLRTCLGPRQAAYRGELHAYVRPWAHVLDDIRCETEIWSGSLDDWAPPAMSEALKERLGDRASLNVCPGLGHYSTLRTALSRLD